MGSGAIDKVNMKDEIKTKEQPINELMETDQSITELETLAAKYQQAKLVLWESQAHFVRILDTANEAIISVDETQRIILFNQGAERIFGYSSDEIIGQLLDILIPERFVSLHHHHIADFARSAATARMMGERQEISGRRKDGEEFPAEASISKLETGGGRIFTVVLRDITKRKQAEREREESINALKALSEAARAITAELSLEQVLHKIAETARILIKAKYAVLGVHDGQGHFARFVAAGISQADQAKIGDLPTGRGVLGILLHQGQSIIVNDIAHHPAAAGFPDLHPIMRSLLGVPIYSKRELIGAVYLADKEDGTDFTENDQQLIEMLAYHAAIAIENARLYERTQRLAILEERDRFARDLHDGIIQSIYGVGLSLDNLKATFAATNQVASEQIDLSLKSLAQVINDIRNYIFDLRPQALKNKGLYARLDGLIKELKVNNLLFIETDIDPNINAYLTYSQASHIFHIAHEALANVARHAKASKIYLGLTKEENTIRLRVEDDGIGFEPSSQINHGHHGLTNIQSRVSQLDAIFNIDSMPQQGTRLTVTLNLDARSK